MKPSLGRLRAWSLAVLLAEALSPVGCGGERAGRPGRAVLALLRAQVPVQVTLKPRAGPAFDLIQAGGQWRIHTQGWSFPAAPERVQALLDAWRGLDSETSYQGGNEKLVRRLGLHRPCLSVTFRMPTGRVLQARLACRGRAAVAAAAGGLLHRLRARPAAELGLRPPGWFRSRGLLLAGPADITRLRIERHDPDGQPKAIELLRQERRWGLRLAGHLLPTSDEALHDFLVRLGAARWRRVEQGKPGPSTSWTWRVQFFRNGKPAEILLFGSCPESEGTWAARQAPDPAQGCLEAPLAPPEAAALLDLHLFGDEVASLERLEWPGRFLLRHTDRGWVLETRSGAMPCDPSATGAYLEALRGLKAESVAKPEGRRGPCLTWWAARRSHRACILRAPGDGMLLQRDEEPVALRFGRTALLDRLVPKPARLRSRLLLDLSWMRHPRLRVVRRGLRLVVARDERGRWRLETPQGLVGDEDALAGFGAAVERLRVSGYGPVADFEPEVSIASLPPGAADLRALLSEAKGDLPGVLASLVQWSAEILLGFRLELQLGQNGCRGRLSDIGFRLSASTCRALSASLVSRRLFPGLTPSRVAALQVCGQGRCVELRQEGGRCRAKPARSSMDSGLCREHLGRAVQLRADDVVGPPTGRLRSTMRLCLTLRSMADLEGRLGQQAEQVRPCALVGPKTKSGRLVVVPGRKAAYLVSERALAPFWKLLRERSKER